MLHFRFEAEDYIGLVQAMERRRATGTLDSYYRLLAESGWPGDGRSLPQGRPRKAEFDIYWGLRYKAFSLWDSGIRWDWTGLHSVKPESLALQLADRIPGEVVLDAFCGIGGCAIALARKGKQVIAVEIDKNRIEMARWNARLYGVEEKITFIHGDAVEQVGRLQYDAVLFDPPWGGAEYKKKKEFGWDDFPLNPAPLIRDASKRCGTVVLTAPVGFRIKDISMDGCRHEIQEAVLDGQRWWLNIFYRNDGFTGSKGWPQA